MVRLGFIACPANNTTGTLGNPLDGGSRDMDILGERDARAQKLPCARWEVGTFQFNNGGAQLEAG